MIKQIFVNLPVENLERSIAFFSKMGFSFNPQFTDENATCMIIGENMFAMLLVKPFFKSFIQKEISNAKKTSEVILAISLENRFEVDELMVKAISAGAKEPRKPQDLGWMYQRGFEDPDGHLWEVFFMDPAKAGSNP
ncbi:MAG: glyoxalase [Candidatus Diapherotrites archaeon]|uniref:Glyoxalase n=1 Tax=Candidatus Iainarchaeum sp. TaxID=3101447 RepID=A0A8T4L7S6_9ARCH|nr:glyoxalase [Candidatus Diapherotrites archaeon]